MNFDLRGKYLDKNGFEDINKVYRGIDLKLEQFKNWYVFENRMNKKVIRVRYFDLKMSNSKVKYCANIDKINFPPKWHKL